MADVERERVTALWREAAAALEPGDYYRDPESGEHFYAPDKPAAPPPCAECGRLRERVIFLDDGARCLCGHTSYWHSHGGKGDCEATEDCECAGFDSSDPQRMLKLNALVRAEKAEVECGRLREQLDAARQALEKIADHPIVGERGPDEDCDWHCTAELVAAARAGRAALGVEGEQEKP